jgi:hypothetical protein
MFIPALRVFSYVDVEVMLISAPHERVLAETGAATTNRLVSTAMVKTTPNILDNFVFIYLFKILLVRISTYVSINTTRRENSSPALNTETRFFISKPLLLSQLTLSLTGFQHRITPFC